MSIETKIKVTSAEIVVNKKSDKPYYEIKYRKVGESGYYFGYSSYYKKYVEEWLKECFEVCTEL